MIKQIVVIDGDDMQKKYKNRSKPCLYVKMLKKNMDCQRKHKSSMFCVMLLFYGDKQPQYSKETKEKTQQSLK